MVATRVGIFLASLGVFFFEIVCAGFLGFTLGSGYVLVVIPLAMMGLSVAGSALTCLSPAWLNRARPGWRTSLSLLLAASFLVLYHVNALAKHWINGALEHGTTLDAAASRYFPVVVAAMLIPYLLFGLLISLVFRESKRADFNSLYFYDMAGGALGCVVAYLILQQGWFAASLAVPSLSAILAAGCFARGHVDIRRSFALSACALAAFAAVFVPWRHQLEPRPNLQTLARTADKSLAVEEIWSGWNSYSRVGAIRVGNPPSYRLMLGNGEGQANLYYFDSGNPKVVGQKTSALQVTLLLPHPKRALILMAGAGADMLALDKLTEGTADITGVELNNRVYDGAMALGQFNLAAFFAKPNIHLVIDEARAYLERDTSQYDVILASFSGATAAYYAGSMGHTTQYVYTVEGLTAMISRLRSGGGLVILNTNKVRQLANLRHAFRRLGLSEARKSVVLLGNPAGPDSRWDQIWDQNRLLIKPDGFTSSDVERISLEARSMGMSVLYSPYGLVHPEYRIYEEILGRDDFESVLANIAKTTGKDFQATFDDKPFIFNVRGLDAWTNPAFLVAAFNLERLDPDRFRLVVALFIAIAGAVSILTPALVSGGIKMNVLNFNHLVYFGALGAGFMFIEIGLVHKLSLLVGDTGLSLALVLGGIVFFTGLGSLLGGGRNTSPSLNILWLIAYLFAFVAVESSLTHFILRQPLIARASFALLLIAVPALIMGRFMPYGLAQCQADDVRLTTWAWAINGAAGTFIACFAPILAQLFGFNAVILCGLFCYSTIFLLPRYRTFEIRGALAVLKAQTT